MLRKFWPTYIATYIAMGGMLVFILWSRAYYPSTASKPEDFLQLISVLLLIAVIAIWSIKYDVDSAKKELFTISSALERTNQLLEDIRRDNQKNKTS